MSYNRINHLREHLNNMQKNNSIIFPPEFMKKLEEMFNDIQTPFNKFNNDDIGFLNYNYILYKFFEILDREEYKYLCLCPLLQNKNKLQKYDNIWKDICKELDWEFIKSV